MHQEYSQPPILPSPHFRWVVIPETNFCLAIVYHASSLTSDYLVYVCADWSVSHVRWEGMESCRPASGCGPIFPIYPYIFINLSYISLYFHQSALYFHQSALYFHQSALYIPIFSSICPIYILYFHQSALYIYPYIFINLPPIYPYIFINLPYISLYFHLYALYFQHSSD